MEMGSRFARLTACVIFLLSMVVVDNTLAKKINKKANVFGCLNVYPSPAMKRSTDSCVKELQKDLIKGLSLGEVNMDGLSLKIRAMLKCKYDVMGAFGEDETINRAALLKVLEDGSLRGAQQDLKFLAKTTEQCLQQFTSVNVIDGIVRLEMCLMEEIYRECEQRSDDADALLPIMVTAMSLAVKNTACESVQTPETVIEVYEECKRNPKKIKIDLSTVDPQTRLMVQLVMQNEVLRSVACRYEKLGLFSVEEGLNYTAIEDFIGSFDEWQDDEVRTTLMDSLRNCWAGNSIPEGDSEEADDGSEEIISSRDFISCFLQRFARICGLKNELAASVIPLISDDEVRGAVLDTVKKIVTLLGKEAFFDSIGSIIFDY